MANGSTVRRNPRVVSRELARSEGAVLLSLDTGAYYSLNDVGARIWQALERPIGLDELVERVLQAYEETSPTVKEDVTSYVEQLAARDLVHVSAGEPSSTSG